MVYKFLRVNNFLLYNGWKLHINSWRIKLVYLNLPFCKKFFFTQKKRRFLLITQQYFGENLSRNIEKSSYSAKILQRQFRFKKLLCVKHPIGETSNRAKFFRLIFHSVKLLIQRKPSRRKICSFCNNLECNCRKKGLVLFFFASTYWLWRISNTLNPVLP